MSDFDDPGDVERDRARQELTDYERGLVDGIRRFAYWNDGVQYVGTSGRTLPLAIREALEAKRAIAKAKGE